MSLNTLLFLNVLYPSTLQYGILPDKKCLVGNWDGDTGNGSAVSQHHPKIVICLPDSLKGVAGLDDAVGGPVASLSPGTTVSARVPLDVRQPTLARHLDSGVAQCFDGG